MVTIFVGELAKSGKSAALYQAKNLIQECASPNPQLTIVPSTRFYYPVPKNRHIL